MKARDRCSVLGLAICLLMMLSSIPTTVPYPMPAAGDAEAGEAHGTVPPLGSAKDGAEYLAPVPAPGLGSMLRTNALRNSGFENWTGIDLDQWFEYTHGRVRSDYVTTRACNGSRSAGLNATGSAYSPAIASFRYPESMGAPLQSLDNATLDLWWFVESNPNPANDCSRVGVNISFNDWRSFEYIFSGWVSSNNSNWNVYIKTDNWGQTGSWYHFHTNLTKDYEDIVGDPSGKSILGISLFVRSSRGETYATRAFFDDVSMKEGNNETIQNSGFEDDSWWFRENLDTGYIAASATHATEGTLSVNMTACSLGYDSVSMIWAQDWFMDGWPSYWCKPNDGVRLEVDWWLNITNWAVWPSPWSRGIVTIYFKNQTGHKATINYVLGNGSSPFPYSNNTAENVYWVFPEGSGTLENWVTLNRSLHSDLSSLTNNTGFLSSPYALLEKGEFSAIASAHGNVTLLIDNARLFADVIPNGDFEQQSAPNQEINGWDGASTGGGTQKTTIIAHTGTYAANITAAGSSESSLSRTYLNVTCCYNLTLELYWNLMNFTATLPSSMTEIVLGFTTGEAIHYLIDTGDGSTPTNTSTDKYIRLSDFGVHGSWIHLRRYIRFDFHEAFGSITTPELHSIRFHTVSETGGLVVLLIDDIRIFEFTSPPTIVSTTHTPPTPAYTDTVTVTTTVYDYLVIENVTLWYSIDGGTWVAQEMVSGVGANYSATIPAQSWRTTVRYYVQAFDILNASSRDPTTGNFSYTVQDDVPPDILSVSQIPDAPTYNDAVTVNVTSSDAGSGINNVTLFYRLDGNSWTQILMTYMGSNLYSAIIPTQPWDSLVEYYIMAIDNAGNNKTAPSPGHTYSYTVGDRVPPQVAILFHSPNTPDPSTNVTIITSVYDPGTGSSGIKNVTLYYQVNGGSWTILLMTPINDTAYEATIPAQPVQALINYYVIVYDKAGNSLTSTTNSYTVTSSTTKETTTTLPPSLSLLPVIIILVAVSVFILVLLILLVLTHLHHPNSHGKPPSGT